MAAAKEVNDLYQNREYLTTEELQSKVDNMFNPDNKEKFDEAIAAAKKVNAMYVQGMITYDVLRNIFPKVHF